MSRVLLVLAIAITACGGVTSLASTDGGAIDGSTIDGGSGDPGKIACGALVCDTHNNEYCCMESPTLGTCRDKSAKSLCTGFVMECDDSTDCPAAMRICCLRPQGAVSNASAGCQSTCIQNAETYQLCRVAAECEYDNDAGCVAETCGGRALRTCGAIYPPSCK